MMFLYVVTQLDYGVNSDLGLEFDAVTARFDFDLRIGGLKVFKFFAKVFINNNSLFLNKK